MVEPSLCWTGVAEDALFAAMAAIGFSSISHTPRHAFFVCGFAAAVGHSLRFLIMNGSSLLSGIVVASFIAAFAVGTIAVIFSRIIRVPAEACLFPALLPMIPGMYAYRAIGGLVGCVTTPALGEVNANFILMGYNMLMTMAIVLSLIIGGNAPVFIFKKMSFQATRQSFL
ncbi:MAG: threonine/serine exporter [Muribaculaceae bacterium]|nr:threonine/serine exporter [Muribaculaceae bacterium]